MKMTNDPATYRAVQAVAPGQLELTTKPLREPPPGYVRIRVEACGVCHSDVERAWRSPLGRDIRPRSLSRTAEVDGLTNCAGIAKPVQRHIGIGDGQHW